MIDQYLWAAAEAKANFEFMQRMAKERAIEYENKLKLAYQGWVKMTTDGSFSEPKISFEEFRAMKEMDLL